MAMASGPTSAIDSTPTERLLRIAGFILCVSCPLLAAAPGEAEELPWKILGSYSDASVDGYLQTPSGGQPGTSSARRPTFDELNAEPSRMYELQVRYGTERHQLLVGSHIVRHHTIARLSQELISQQSDFAAGTVTDLDLKSDWSELRYIHRVSEIDLLGRPLDIRLTGGLVWFDFDYQLSGDSVLAHRAYSKVGYTLGMDYVWSLSDRFSLEGRVIAPLPVSNTPRYWSAGVDARYAIARGRRGRLTLLTGVGMNDVTYRDNQELSNFIKLTQEPAIRIGMELAF